MKLLERSSDSDIAGWVEAYETFLAAAAATDAAATTTAGATKSSKSSRPSDRDAVTAPNVDLGVELVWR